MPWDDEEQREISRRRWFVKHWFGRPYIVSNPEVEMEEPRREIRESKVPVRLGNRDYIWRNYEVSPEVGEGIRDYIKTSFRMAGERMQDPVYAALSFGPGTIKEVSPRVFLRPSDIVKQKSFGGGTYHGLADSPAEVIQGIPVTKADLPEKLYHVTTSPDVIRKSRMLRSMHGEKARGLGKGSSRAHQGVSFTMNRQVAENIQRNLKRNIRLAQESDDFAEAVYRYAREDELAAGLPEGALNEAVEASLSDYRVRIAKLGEEPRYAADSSINIYRWRVEDLGGPENPIIFGSADDFARLDASRVDILEVPTGNIPEDVLIRKHPLGSKHLDEVMVHSDVPVDMPAVAPVGKGVAGGKDVVGGAGRGGIALGVRGDKVRFVHGTSREAVPGILEEGIKTSDKMGGIGGEPWVSGYTNLERSQFGDVDVVVEVARTPRGVMKEAVEPGGEMVRVWRDIRPEEIIDIIDRRTGKSLLVRK